jgi:hypothetical protein
MTTGWDSSQWEQEDRRDYHSMCLSVAEQEFYTKLLQMTECDYARHHYLYKQAANDALKVFREMLIAREGE